MVVDSNKQFNFENTVLSEQIYNTKNVHRVYNIEIYKAYV